MVIPVFKFARGPRLCPLTTREIALAPKGVHKCLPTAWRCPSQHKNMVLQVYFNPARTIRFSQWMRPLRPGDNIVIYVSVSLAACLGLVNQSSSPSSEAKRDIFASDSGSCADSLRRAQLLTTLTKVRRSRHRILFPKVRE